MLLLVQAKKKVALPKSAAAAAAAAAEAAARADMEAARAAAEEEERLALEEEEKQRLIEAGLLEPDAEIVECGDCIAGTSGQCKTENGICREIGEDGVCPEGYEQCEPWIPPCAETDNEEECFALMLIYNHTGGAESWKQNKNWAEPVTICHWFGIVCDEDKEHVKEIYLDSNNLTGPILSWEGLYWLESIHIEANPGLNGSLPDLGLVTELRHLNMGANSLTGTIPQLFTCPNLQELYLDSNKLTGPIPDLYGLNELQLLQLYRNKLTGTIPALEALKELEFLMLNENKLTGTLPTSLGMVTKLKALSAHTNKLEGDVPDLSELQRLEFM
jgi:hypothetical protein